MKYQERVGDRWKDPDDGEVVEVIEVTDKTYRCKSITNETRWISPTTIYYSRGRMWDNWTYLGNFNKASNSQTLYNKLNATTT